MNFFKIIMSIVLVCASSAMHPRGGDIAAGMMMGTTTGLIVGSAMANNNNNARDARVERELAEERHERSYDKVRELRRENDDLRRDLRDLRRRLDELEGSKKGPEKKKRKY